MESEREWVLNQFATIHDFRYLRGEMVKRLEAKQREIDRLTAGIADLTAKYEEVLKAHGELGMKVIELENEKSSAIKELRKMTSEIKARCK